MITKQQLVRKEEFIGHVASVEAGTVRLESGKSVTFDPAVHALKAADKEIPAWRPPDYHLLPELNKVVSEPEPGKPVKVLPEDEAQAVVAQFADSHTAKEASDHNLAVNEPTGQVDIRERERQRDEESRRLQAAADADKSKKSNK